LKTGGKKEGGTPLVFSKTPTVGCVLGTDSLRGGTVLREVSNSLPLALPDTKEKLSLLFPKKGPYIVQGVEATRAKPSKSLRRKGSGRRRVKGIS